MATHRLTQDAGAWMRGNLSTQGYCLTDEQRRELALGLRFSTGLCLALVVVALVLESAALLFALSVVGIVAGFTSRHPFDLAWNHGARHVFAAAPVPPNPPRRRHAFKLATAWLVITGTLLATGATTAGLALGVLLVAACAIVTATNLCLPSEAMALWDRHHQLGRLV